MRTLTGSAGRWSRPTVVSGLPVVIHLICGLMAAGGLLVISTTFLPAASGGRVTWAVRLLDVIAVSGACLVWLFAPRLRMWWQHVMLLSAVLLISLAVLASGGGSTALAYGCVYLLVPVYSFFILSRRAATVHLLATLCTGVPVLAAQPGVGPGEQIILWGISVLLSAVIGWLVGVVDESEIDPLTGLANRRGTERALARAVVTAAGDGALAFALLDLDHFKAFNDNHGAAAGDRLIADQAHTWAPLVPDGCLLGRYGGDEFALVLPGRTAQEATALVEVLREHLRGSMTCSAGTAAWTPGESASMLVARTDAAVYTAKHQGRSRTHQHPGGGTDGREVREALARGDFAVYFQPVVELSSGRTVGAEALVRWVHPDKGLVPPSDFLPDAERCGVILELGAWVLEESCRQAATWPTGPEGQQLRVSVNASGRELQHACYAGTVQRALEASGLAPERLTIELVESSYDVESIELVSNLHQLRVLGVATAIDDFGVGSSGPDRVRRLGVDLLKIDRSFVTDITHPDGEAPLVLAMLAMADALGVAVVAEGIETPEQAEWLRRRGCRYGQGYLLGRPAPGAPDPTAAVLRPTDATVRPPA